MVLEILNVVLLPTTVLILTFVIHKRTKKPSGVIRLSDF